MKWNEGVCFFVMKKIFFIKLYLRKNLYTNSCKRFTKSYIARNEGKIRMETRGRVIGIDIGTTSAKTVVFTEKGKVVASHAIDYPIIQPNVGWAEQDPDVICAAVFKTVSVAIEESNVLPEDISSIGISTAMHALIAVDENGAPLTRSIIWADNRSTKQSEKLLEHMNGHEIYRRTGTPIHPMSPLSKLLWMKEEELELYKSAYKFISILKVEIHSIKIRCVVLKKRKALAYIT